MALKKTNWDDYDYSLSSANKFFLDRVLNGYKALLTDAKLAKGVKIVELGSGTGFNSFRLAKLLSASKVVLVDFNDNALRAGKASFGSDFNVKLVKGDVLTVNLSEKFDLVHSQGLIEHFQGDKFKQVINAHLRLLKKGGYLVVFYPTSKFLYPFVRRLMSLFNKWIFSDEVPLTKDEVIRAVGGKATFISSVIVTPYALTEEGLLFCKN